MSEFTHEFFEEASKEFMRGKIRRGDMMYYGCQAILISGKACQRTVDTRLVEERDTLFLCKLHTRPKNVEPITDNGNSGRLLKGVCAPTRQYSRFGRRLIPTTF
jgi:hypothetical protein